MTAFQIVFLAVIVCMQSLMCVPCNAEITNDLFERPLTGMGYGQQSVGYSIESGDHYDTKQDFQSFLFLGLLETKYEPIRNFQIFASCKLNADWAYHIFDANDEWQSKGFDDGNDDLCIYDEAQDILKEAQITWTSENYYFRLGKLIVAWGQTDVFRLMDQINLLDQRRGLADVQFDTPVINRSKF